jgi:hypothetical protein
VNTQYKTRDGKGYYHPKFQATGEKDSEVNIGYNKDYTTPACLTGLGWVPYKSRTERKAQAAAAAAAAAAVAAPAPTSPVVAAERTLTDIAAGTLLGMGSERPNKKMKLDAST